MNCWRCKQKFCDNSVLIGLCDNCVSEKAHLNAYLQSILLCEDCELHKTATNKVPGRGFWAAPILFLGEAPGANEDKQGLPFVGAAGKVLELLITTSGLPEDSYFITNIIRCRPPSNRVPLPNEVEACSKHLERTINYIKPHIIVTLGATSTKYILGDCEAMTDMRGKIHYDKYLKILPVYHPAALLYNRSLYDVTLEDFGLLKKLYDGLIADRVIR